PIGRPLSSKPTGIDKPGSPAKFTGTVNKSAMYISIGSSFFSPNLKAVPVVTGDTIKSTSEKMLSNASLINIRTLAAFMKYSSKFSDAIENVPVIKRRFTSSPKPSVLVFTYNSSKSLKFSARYHNGYHRSVVSLKMLLQRQ